MSTSEGERWSIGEVARRSGVAASTLRYYESIGLLSPAERAGGRRVYDPDILPTLGVIRTAQSAGLSLEEIGSLLRGSDMGVAGERLSALAEVEVPEVEALIERAQAIRVWLETARQCCCPTLEECGLFPEVVRAA